MPVWWWWGEGGGKGDVLHVPVSWASVVGVGGVDLISSFYNGIVTSIGTIAMERGGVIRLSGL